VKRVDRICKTCGKHFLALASEVRRGGGVFCCRDCWRADAKKTFGERSKATPRLRGLDNPRNTLEEIICYGCGQPYLAPRWKRERNARHFCSKNCYETWRSNESRALDTKCTVCGIYIRRDASNAKRNSNFFCSKECYAKWRSVTICGEVHPHWRGGTLDYYGEDWRKARRMTRDRDGYRCQRCRITEEEIGTELDVHHIIPKRYGGSNALSNLISLCHRCHIIVEWNTYGRGDRQLIRNIKNE